MNKQIYVRFNTRDTGVQFLINEDGVLKTLLVKPKDVKYQDQSNLDSSYGELMFLDKISSELVKVDCDKKNAIMTFMNKENILDNSFRKRISYIEKLEKNYFNLSLIKYIETIRDVLLHKKSGEYTFIELDFITFGLNNISIILALLEQYKFIKSLQEVKIDKLNFDRLEIYKELAGIIQKRRST